MIIAENPFKMGYISGRFVWDSGFVNLPQGLGRDDSALGNILGTIVPTQRAVRRVTGLNFTTNSPAYADINNLNVLIRRPGDIQFEYWLLYNTNDPAEGIGVQLAFNGTAGGVAYTIEAYTDPATRAPLVSAVAFGSGVPPFSVGPGAPLSIIAIKGSCNIVAVGTLSVQARAETGGANSATVFTNSWGYVSAIS